MVNKSKSYFSSLAALAMTTLLLAEVYNEIAGFLNLSCNRHTDAMQNELKIDCLPEAVICDEGSCCFSSDCSQRWTDLQPNAAGQRGRVQNQARYCAKYVIPVAARSVLCLTERKPRTAIGTSDV